MSGGPPFSVRAGNDVDDEEDDADDNDVDHDVDVDDGDDGDVDESGDDGDDDVDDGDDGDDDVTDGHDGDDEHDDHFDRNDRVDDECMVVSRAEVIVLSKISVCCWSCYRLFFSYSFCRCLCMRTVKKGKEVRGSNFFKWHIKNN